jgi:glucose 1-dehydrogenase
MKIRSAKLALLARQIFIFAGVIVMTALDQFSLAGKVALVTGNARGIGRAIAGGLVAAGAKVWLTDILEAEGATVAEALKARFVKADLASLEEIGSLVNMFKAEESHLDILVNNAGIGVPMSLENLDMERFEHVWKVNARAPVALTHLLLPLLKNSPMASVINITSLHAETPHPGNLPYNMSKAALAMFTKSMSQELAAQGIRMNNIAPGAIETEINRGILDDMGRENFNQWIPMGRVGQTHDLVGAAIFLASDAARYVTGTTIHVDGGYLHNLVRYRLDV